MDESEQESTSASVDEPSELEQEQTAERVEELRPRIYVARLSDYNAGRLHGAWLDAARDVEALEADIAAMLAASPEPWAEEWAIHDYEGFGSWQLSEYESLAIVSAVALGIVEHEPAFAAWASLLDTPELDRLAAFEEAYRGTWESIDAYAEHLLEEFGATEELEGIRSWLRPYVQVDVAAFARDLVLSGDITTREGGAGVHVFDAHV